MKAGMKQAVDGVRPQLAKIIQDMYGHPELGGEEHLAAGLHVAFLEGQGFAVTKGICGWETGYRAEFDSGKPGPHVAFLAEYDALPGVGHGCGHNLLGCCSLAAGVALKAQLAEIGGRMTIFGAPAEETTGAKVDYADQGALEGVDFAMLCHPGSQWSKSGDTLALMPLQFEYFGKTSHAASMPEKGINALDGALVTMTAINALREHVRSDARIHGIVVDGGKAANIVPDYAKLQYYVRATKKGYLTQLVERVKNCAKAGALASGTRVEITQFEYAYDNLLTNHVLADLFADTLEGEFGIVMEPANPNTGSTDLGNVSQVCPAIQSFFDITGDPTVVAHSVQMADATVTPYGLEAMETAAVTMALVAAKVMGDPNLLKSVQEEFAQVEK